MGRKIRLRRSTTFYSVRFLCEHEETRVFWTGTEAAQEQAREQVQKFAQQICSACTQHVQH